MLSTLFIASKMNDSGCSITGDVVSITEIVWVADAELPDVSVAVQVTIVSPSGNTSGASLVIEEISTLSDASAESNSTILASSEIASTCISAGVVMIGTVVSMTCISCSNVDELPDMSITVQVTIVVPNSNDTGASLDTNATSVLSLDSIVDN